MQKSIGIMALLALAGLLAMPAAAGELRVTGFIDSAITTEQNTSGNSRDFDVTNNQDNVTVASTRSQIFFNFIASDDLRGIFAIELDQTWGQCAQCRGGGDSFSQDQNGFGWAIDNNVFELKQLYVDFRIPQLPFGNRWRVGGPRFQATPLHSNLLLAIDAGGADVNLTFSPQVSLLLYYMQIEEDGERSPLIATKIGEDYLTGATLMLKPLPRWDLHFPFLYQHLQAPFGTISGGLGTPFSGTTTPRETTNITTEDRYYLGVDSRYRLGNLNIEPSFLYLTGTRKFCRNSDGVPVRGHGTSGRISDAGDGIDPLVACTSAATGGVSDIDINAFGGMLTLNYVMGKWLLSGRFVYTSGDEATLDRNNEGLTQGRTRGDSNAFRIAGAESAHWTQWLSILGNSNFGDGRHDVSPLRLGEASNLGLDRFGHVLGAGKVEYKLRDNLIVRGIVGGVWTAETPACPAVQRRATTATSSARDVARGFGCGDLKRDFTGDSRYLGTEVDLWLEWSIMPGLLNRIGGGYAFLGDGLQIFNPSNNRDGKVQDAWYLLNRLLYVF